MDATANPLRVKKIVTRGLSPVSNIIRRNELGALTEASAIIAAAERDASSIIEAARNEAESIRAGARIDAEKTVWANAAGLLADLKSTREEVCEQSIEVAQSILHKAWEILSGSMADTERLDAALHQAGRYFVSTSAMKLRVHPSNTETAKVWLDTRRNQQAGLELLTVEPDISLRLDEVRLYLDRGGVIRADFNGALEILKAQWT